MWTGSGFFTSLGRSPQSTLALDVDLCVADLTTAPISPHNDVPLATIKESPVLVREGVTQNTFEQSGNPVPTMEGVSLHLRTP